MNNDTTIILPEQLQKKIEDCTTLPSIPSVVFEILQLCNKEDVGAADAAKLILKDPALSAKVLKVSNSPLYGLCSQVTTIDRAVAIMGLNATLSLTLSFSIVHSLHSYSSTSFNYNKYWKRSLITAIAAGALSEYAGLNWEEMFLAGLLQDIGMLVLFQAYGESYCSAIEKSASNHRKLVELEKTVLDTDHSVVGAWLLQHWKFPENLQRMVAASHNLDIPAESPRENCVLTAALAGCIADIWCNPNTAESTAEAHQAAADLLDITPTDFSQVLNSIVSRLPEVSTALEINVGDQDKLIQVLEKAREALITLNLHSQLEVHKMEDAASRDILTTLYNRTYLENILARHMDTAVRYNRFLSLIFIDIDNFKSVNDSYGHHAGDCILVETANTLKSILRNSDIATRYGGDEFVCLLPETTEEGVKIVAEKIRQAVAETPHKIQSNPVVRVTVCIGCATFSLDHIFRTPKEFIQAADQCLYAAKQAGRNRIASTEDLEDSEIVC